MRPGVCVLLALIGLPACRTEAPPHRPNVLLFTLDTTRVDVIGCYGSTLEATPNVDRLAASGARFSRAYTVTPLTIPAHSSIHTGLYPPRHGVRDNGDFFLEDGAVTLAERLKVVGYDTMASVGAEVTSHHWGFGQGFDRFSDQIEGSETAGNRWAVERRGDAVVDDALAWLGAPERANAPWFAWVHLFDAHHPYAAPEEWAAKFPGRPYLAEVAYADAQIGRVLDALEARGALDDTLVIVVADHGEGLGDHGEALHGMLLYDATTRVPMVLRPPGGIPGGRVEAAPASLVDLVPTVLTQAGLAVPDDLDGVDLSPALQPEGGSVPPTRSVYAESLYAWHVYGWAPQYALVDADYKLISSTTPELYAAADRPEKLDLSTKQPDKVVAMKDALARKTAGWSTEDGLSARAALSSERASQLAALGYVDGSFDEGPTDGLPDPVSHMQVLGRITEARQALVDKRYADAETLARGVLADDAGLLPARLLMVDALAGQQRVDDAIAAAREALELRDASATHAMLGRLLLRAGHPEEARTELERALDQDPYVATTWATYLQLLYVDGDIASVQQAIDKASAVLPDAPFVLATQGALLTDTGRYDDAEVLLRQALEADPKAPFAHYFLGVVASSRDDAATAEVEYLVELADRPTFYPARLKLVELYGKQQRFEDQIVQLEALGELMPPSPVHRWALAQALFNAGRIDEAAVEVGACRVTWPDYPECAMLEANVLAKQGNRPAAEAAYQEALRLKGEAP